MHKNPFIYLLLIAFSQLFTPVLGQNQNVYRAEVRGDDTIAIIDLQPVRIMGEIGEKGEERRQKYHELIYDVRQVYPYAKFFAAKMEEIDSTLKTFDDRKKRKQYLKREEKKLKDDLKSRLKDLTYDQGRLLIKLINRETGKTSYELIKRYKSGIKATMWQTAAKVFSMDLKNNYNKEEEEAIEKILKAIETDKLKLNEKQVKN